MGAIVTSRQSRRDTPTHPLPAGAKRRSTDALHYGLEPKLCAEPFVIDANRAELITITVMLRDFSFTPASQILNNVVAGERGGGTAMAKRLADFPWHQPRPLLTQQWDEVSQRFGWKRDDGVLMMAPDVVYDALLANERSLDDPQIIDVEPGETVAIRWLAGSAFMSFFLDLVSSRASCCAPCQSVEPIRGSVFQLALAQRLTLRLPCPKPGGVSSVNLG